MLNKDEIIKGLANEEFIVSNAVYEYVCNLHLYDDEQINETFIKFLENHYSHINYAGLIYSKINQPIIQCLIKIVLGEKNSSTKNSIGAVLVKHFNLIKDMEYPFEDIITDETDLLLYKKIKHFSRKDPDQLIEFYANNVREYYLSEEDTYTTEILRKAMGTALVQTKKGQDNLKLYMKHLMEQSEEEYENLEDFCYIHMPYLIEPLCEYASFEYFKVILGLYLENMDFIGYADECNYYFSQISNPKFVQYYINTLKRFKEKELQDYYYDIAEYLNSEVMDEFLLKELDRKKDNEIRENIIRILASKFNKDVIPYALEHIRKGNFEEEEMLKEAIAPLFILEQCNDEIAKQIIEEVKNYDILDLLKEDEMISDILNNFQNFMLKNKPHIKKYKKARKLHDEIMGKMMQYFAEDKFELEIQEEKTKSLEKYVKEVTLLSTEFNLRTELGIQAMANILVYKNSTTINCITEEFIEKKIYRNKEKLKLLDSMLNSEAGLFEITKTDMTQGQIYLKNVLNKKEYCMTDIGFSSNLHNDQIYLYTRLISYDGVVFGSGFNLAFSKQDPFICKWIEDNTKHFNEKQEITRFIELYNRYKSDENKIGIHYKN